MNQEKIKLEEVISELAGLRHLIEPDALLEDLISEKNWIISKQVEEMSRLREMIEVLETRNARLSYTLYQKIKKNPFARWAKKKIFPQGIDHTFLARFKGK